MDKGDAFSKMVFKASTMKNDELNQQLMALPVKEHIHKIEFSIQELNQELECSKNFKQQIKIEMNNQREELHQQRDEMDHLIKGQLEVLSLQLVNIQQINKQEVQFLGSQCVQIKSDKVKIGQNILVVENQVNEVEKDMGFQTQQEI